MSDSNEVLFEITQAHLNTGLRGFPVGTVRTSFVSPDEGLHYVGYPVSKVWNVDPEAAVYLLLNKELPTAEQLSAFKAELVARSPVSPAVLNTLAQLPKERLGCVVHLANTNPGPADWTCWLLAKSAHGLTRKLSARKFPAKFRLRVDPRELLDCRRWIY